MRIGIPTEVKLAEKRVALTPEACARLVQEGHQVFLQKGAGEGAGFENDTYTAVGVEIKEDAKNLYDAAELIVKVKEPLDGDLEYLRKDHILFCYLHLAAEPNLVERLKQIGLTAISFETVVVDGKTPLLAPMSAIAGRLATQIGTWFLHSPRGGRGVLIGGIEGFHAGNVTVVGAGVAGSEAARLAYNMGATVTMLDINTQRLQELKNEMPELVTVPSTEESILAVAKNTDIMVGAVYVIGQRAPVIITEEHVKVMPKGSVLVDISIDQGGCCATSRPCTHLEPTYVEHNVIHSAITNLPAAAPRTASEALSMAITPYVQQIVNEDWSTPLIEGVNVEGGELKIEL